MISSVAQGQQATTQEGATTSAATTATTTGRQPARRPPSLPADPGRRAQSLRRASGRRPETRPQLLACIAYVPGNEPLCTVMAQSPAAGGSAKTGSRFTLSVSSGPNDTQVETVPDVVGQRIPQAVATLHRVGLRLILLRGRVGDVSQAGLVVAQTPVPGSRRPRARRCSSTSARSSARPAAVDATHPRADRRGAYQPRVSSSSLGSSVAVEMPTIGSPRPAETRASTSASM